MRFHLEATPAELWQKGTALIEELVKAFAQTNPSLSEVLEKALPPKEQNLKYPMLRGLKDVTSKEYDAMTKRMLADISKVLDQSVKAPGGVLAKAFGEPEEKDPGAEEEEKLEPGDVDPETGDLIPEPEDEEEEGEGEEGEEKSLEKGGPYIGPKGGKWADAKHTIPWHGGDKTKQMRSKLELTRAKTAAKKQQLEATQASVAKKKQQLAEVEKETPAAKKAKAEELKGKIKRVEESTKKVTRKLAREDREMDKALPQSGLHVSMNGLETHIQDRPLDHDFTKPIADKDSIAYARVKRVLIGRGRTESDFEEGGPLYGYSVNELIDLAREERKASQNGST